MFWVITAFNFPARSSSASLRWAALGWASSASTPVPVEQEEFCPVGHEKAAAQNLLRRVGVLLMVQPVLAAEVRDAALGGHARAAEKRDILR